MLQLQSRVGGSERRNLWITSYVVVRFRDGRETASVGSTSIQRVRYRVWFCCTHQCLVLVPAAYLEQGVTWKQGPNWSSVVYLEQGIVVTDSALLRRHYTRTWTFRVDAVSVLPTDALYAWLGTRPRWFTTRTPPGSARPPRTSASTGCCGSAAWPSSPSAPSRAPTIRTRCASASSASSSSWRSTGTPDARDLGMRQICTTAKSS